MDLPLSNRSSNDRWHFVQIYCNNEHVPNLPDALVIAGTQSRIVILRFDMALKRFKAVRALDTATPVSSVLFTQHSAIVSSDKFFEIDLMSLTAEEFLDLSDKSICHARHAKPMGAFKINQQEYLLCFEEFGIFVDEYGCRSRPDDLQWIHTPTGFLYQAPLLFMSSDNLVQVLRINKSHSSVMQMNEDESEIKLRAFINLNKPKILGGAGKYGVFALNNPDRRPQEVIQIEGVKALKNILTNSLETLFSSLSSIPQKLHGSVSIDTISTVNN